MKVHTIPITIISRKWYTPSHTIPSMWSTPAKIHLPWTVNWAAASSKLPNSPVEITCNCSARDEKWKLGEQGNTRTTRYGLYITLTRQLSASTSKTMDLTTTTTGERPTDERRRVVNLSARLDGSRETGRATCAHSSLRYFLDPLLCHRRSHPARPDRLLLVDRLRITFTSTSFHLHTSLPDHAKPYDRSPSAATGRISRRFMRQQLKLHLSEAIGDRQIVYLKQKFTRFYGVSNRDARIIPTIECFFLSREFPPSLASQM